jgi:hypothetical protein
MKVYVRNIPMAKRIQESIGEYVDWLINLNYDRLEKQRRESVSMSKEKRASTEQATGADKFARTIAHLHRRHGGINPKEHRERL